MTDRDQVEVTMHALIDTSAGINAVVDDMSNHDLQAIDELGSDGSAYGHERLAAAAQRFADAWSHGVSLLVRDATGLSEALAESAATYAETEHINIDEFIKQGR